MNKEKSEDLILFIPEHQNQFWKSIDPDIRSFLDLYEKNEDWTYEYDELPEIFISLSSRLPEFMTTPVSNDTFEIIKLLFPILSSLPLRHAVSAIAWLDRNNNSSSELGWGMLIYYSASEIVLSEQDDENYLHAKVIYDRITLMLKTKLASELFCNLNDLDSFGT